MANKGTGHVLEPSTISHTRSAPWGNMGNEATPVGQQGRCRPAGAEAGVGAV